MLPSPRPMVPALLPTVLGLALVGVSLAALRRLARAPTGAFRSGPWPGLTPRGAVLLLVYALLLAGSQLAVGQAELDTARRSALWYVPAIAVGAIAAPVLAARMTGMPGAASAVCGAYLLPRSLASLAFPVLATPPLLLAPAMALDVALWLRPSDLAWLFAAWPRGPAARAKRAWRPRESGPRRFSPARAALAGALAGMLLAILEPADALLLGADPSRWTTEATIVAGLLATLVGATAGWTCALLPAPGSPRRPPVRS